MNYERPALLDKLAGAYVLGTLSGGARRRFARLHARSGAAQRAVADWHNRLAPLYGSIPAVAPPPSVWIRIAERIGHGIAVDSRAQPAAGPGSAWLMGRLRAWCKPVLGFALGAMVATSVVSHNAHLFGMHHMSAALPASYVGILHDEGGRSVLTVGSHRHGDTMTVRLLAPLAVPPGRVARLWALPAHGAPVPVANLAFGDRTPIPLGAAAEERFKGIARLAVSFEEDPEATLPTRAYVASGPCVRFW